MTEEDLEIEKKQKKLKQLGCIQENKQCLDCSTKNPDWCSIPFGGL